MRRRHLLLLGPRSLRDELCQASAPCASSGHTCPSTPCFDEPELNLLLLPSRLPEPKGRTYGELDLLFEQKVPARAFSRTVVDQFSEATPTAPEPTTKAKEDSNIEYEEVVRRQS